jgi:hypothetical protein
MLPRRRCPFCRRWYHPDPRLKRRQKTCGQPGCRHQQKQKANQQWRSKNPDYFRDAYPHQKEKYGTRARDLRSTVGRSSPQTLPVEVHDELFQTERSGSSAPRLLR